MAVGAWIEHVDEGTPDIANFDPESMGQEGRSYAETCANARLCAMAPAMLKELRSIANAKTRAWDDPGEFEAWAKNRARAMINAATGVSQ